MTTKKIIIANWKLERSYDEALSWTSIHRQELFDITKKTTLVICPDIVTVGSLKKPFEEAGVALGSQDCSPYISGKHTGAISAASLRAAGCSYAIIGHSEVRARSSLTACGYATSCFECVSLGITPIFCVGESDEDRHDYKKMERRIEEQIFWLDGIDKNFTDDIPGEYNLYIAYEPVWAIGSGILPSRNELMSRICALERLLKKMHIFRANVRLLYGGGITGENCGWLRDIPALEGLLLGSSSLDMQNLKKIVYSFI